MKFPRIATYLMALFVCCLATHAQTNSLTALSTGVYLKKEKSITQATQTSKNHKTLFAAVKATDLASILETNGPFTVFAPSDNAFSRFTNAELKDLFKTENRKKLKSLLTYHIVAGNLTASKILRAMCRGNGRASFTSVQGNKIMATMQGTDIILTDGLGNSAKITVADANLSNGIIHEIDSVILPSQL